MDFLRRLLDSWYGIKESGAEELLGKGLDGIRLRRTKEFNKNRTRDPFLSSTTRREEVYFTGFVSKVVNTK
jgi:hypothetical protein